MEDYKPGQISGFLFGKASPGSEKKKKKKKSGDGLAALFDVTPTPVELPLPAVITPSPETATENSETGTQKTPKSIKKKKKNAKEKEVDQEEKPIEISAKSPAKKSSGFSPPPGIEHESLKVKEKKISKAEQREAAVLGEKETKKNKAKKRKLADEDDEDEQPVQKKKKNRVVDKEIDQRTVFVGNLPNTCTKKDLKKLFKKYGKVESVRLRSAVPNDPSKPKKVAVIKKEFHPEKHNINAYVVFKDTDTAKKATECNGTQVGDYHIRVDMADQDKKIDHRKSVFVGNVPFNAAEESLRDHFSECGKVANVRIIRDKLTGLGKGFGYILFEDQSSVELALKMHLSKLEGKALRVERSTKKEKKKVKTAPGKGEKGDKKHVFTKASNTAANSFQGVLADKDRQRRLKKKEKKFSKKLSNKGEGGKATKGFNTSNARKRLEAKGRKMQKKR